MSPFADYLRSLREIRRSGQAVPETSYYGTLETFLNELGKGLKPRVRAIINLKNRGAGIPDGGLFSEDQLPEGDADPLQGGQNPARGVLEVKSTAEKVEDVARSAQVAKYLSHYGLVLVTNYRDFLLVRGGANGQPEFLERYALAEGEASFWSAPLGDLLEHEGRLEDFLKRAMLQRAPLSEPKDVAWFLASYAREAKARIEASDLPTLRGVREALEEALGINFRGEKGDHFFRSTLIQTLFYGVFSAWVLWSKEHPPGKDGGARFNWKEAAWTLQVPVIRALFERVATPSRLKGLNLEEVFGWTGDALNRVHRADFFEKFNEGQAVQYFYEPFLEAFDPELRRDLGVWYTPPEVVTYMVERVDRVLRDELGIPDGLADDNVYVLDPCCGTGTYLVEVLARIGQTLRERGGDALLGSDLKKAATRRVFGFEILPAPFVVAHLQLGLLLQNSGAPLTDTGDERAAVYLTNALTGWDVSEEGKQVAVDIPELQIEHDLAENVKDEAPVLVVLGNPPYNAFAGTSSEAEQGLVEIYKEGLRDVWGVKKYNLDELYVRFFRLAEKRIAERTGKGVVCYISNFSYLSDPSFVVMREKLLAEFDRIWIDCLNGDSRETGKITPAGKPDPSVFSTEFNKEGIRKGTAISLMLRKAKREDEPTVRFQHFWGANKRQNLLNSLEASDTSTSYKVVEPQKENRFSLRPLNVTDDYLDWPSVTNLTSIEPFKGFLEARNGALIDIDKEKVESRMRNYYNASISWSELKSRGEGPVENAARFDAEQARTKVLKAETFDLSRLNRYTARPFDVRWAYHSNIRPLWNEPRPSLYAQYWEGNEFIATRMKTEKTAVGSPVYFSMNLVDYQSLARNVSVVPIRLRLLHKQSASQKGLFDNDEDKQLQTVANLSTKARAYLASLGYGDPDKNADTAKLIWMHVISVSYSPNYLEENADGIGRDWPRIPLPKDKSLLESSAALGRGVAGLLETETPVAGVTSGAVRGELRVMGGVSAVAGASLNPDAGDLALRAGWGYVGHRGATMPGQGRVVARDYTPDERAGFEAGAARLGVTLSEMLDLLGTTTLDVYLNDRAYWKNVPSRVWDYTIGGYQVIKKWLSYREAGVLGRALTPDEARHVTHTARRIAGLLLLEPELNENYGAVKAEAYAWPE